LLTVFVAHAEADAEVARELGAFLELGCDVSVFGQDGLIRPGEDLIAAADNGLSADVLVLLLSPASNLTRWVRERWEPVLVARAAELGTRVAVVLHGECTFPGLLRRGAGFFDATLDATTGGFAAWRRLKRWIWGIQLGTEPTMTYSADLDEIYRDVADRVGVGSASAELARRFAREASREFEAVLWVPAYGRSLAQVVCEAGAQLGMRLAGPVAEDCRLVKRVLSERRCLLVMDAPTVRVKAMLPEGRSSVLFTSEPEMVVEEAPSVAGARGLLAAGRVSEAHEMLRKLFDGGVETEQCARELVWIYEQWDRMEEANELRFLVGAAPSEQLRLF
jgi:hypothetical protein